MLTTTNWRSSYYFIIGGALVWWLAATTGCTAAEPGRAPIARVTLAPAFVVAHDNYQTEIMADGSMSADPLDDPRAMQPLLYAWKVDDRDAQIMPSANVEVITFHVAGDRPTAVSLEVTDGDDRKTTTTMLLGVTVN